MTQHRLRWLIVLPSVQDGPRDASGDPEPSLLDAGLWIKEAGPRSRRAPGSFSLRYERLPLDGEPGHEKARAALEAHWPGAVEVLRPGTDHPIREMQLTEIIRFGRIRSQFDVHAVYLDVSISDDRLKVLRRRGLDAAVRDANVRVNEQPTAMVDWALGLMDRMFRPRLEDSLRPTVTLEVIVRGPTTAEPPEQSLERSMGPLGVECGTWGFLVAAKSGRGLTEDDLSVVDDLQEVHALARLQHGHLAELSEAINSAPLHTQAVGYRSPTSGRADRRSRIDQAVKDEILTVKLARLRTRYLKLLKSGLFQYVNSNPTVQALYDDVREQVRLEETHKEILLELELLGAEVDTRMRQRGLDQDREFQTRIKVWGAFIAVASMAAALLQLIVEERRAFGCGWLPHDALGTRDESLMRALDETVCRGLGAAILAVLIGLGAFLVVRHLSIRDLRAVRSELEKLG